MVNGVTLFQVEEVNIFADRKTNMSKGCGFIMMASRDQALHAIEGLNEKYIMQVMHCELCSP